MVKDNFFYLSRLLGKYFSRKIFEKKKSFRKTVL